MAQRSISLRLTIWFSLVYFAGLALFGAAMWFNLQSTLTSGRSRTLERRADRLSDLLREMRNDPEALRTAKFLDFAGATGGGLIEVVRADGTLVFPSPTAASRNFPWPPVIAFQHDRFDEIALSKQPYRVLMRPFASPSGLLVLRLAAPLENNLLVLRTFRVGLLWTVPALLALSAFGGYLLSRRALAPVDRITAATRSIGLANLSGRLPVPNTRDELQRLLETCNEMLARLESAVTEIKRFTADASHELRSPLSFIRTVAELALRNPHTDPESRRAFEEIVEETGKTSHLLEGMLTLARADDGTAHLSFEPVDLVEVLRVICDKARRVAEAQGHALTVSWNGASRATVWGDYASLQQLLWILLENAIKYTLAPGAIKVTETIAGGKAIVTIEDNGIGISTAELPHIFERFYRADRSRSKVEGSGLGLAIARWIADVHKAELTVESRENEGAVFRISFSVLAVDSIVVDSHEETPKLSELDQTARR
jgi:two-component system, OmpR family, heavy metal sensor histidine kinase CusS